MSLYRTDGFKLYHGDRPLLAGPPDKLARFAASLNVIQPEDDNALRAELRLFIEAAGSDVSFAPLIPWTDDELMGLAERERQARERGEASRQISIFDVLAGAA